MTFNIIFMIQNYCIYTSKPVQGKEDENDQLAPSPNTHKRALLDASLDEFGGLNQSTLTGGHNTSMKESQHTEIKTDDSDDEPLAPNK